VLVDVALATLLDTNRPPALYSATVNALYFGAGAIEGR